MEAGPALKVQRPVERGPYSQARLVVHDSAQDLTRLVDADPQGPAPDL